MIRTIIIDDENYIREAIKEKLKTSFNKDIKIVAEASNIEEAITSIEKEKPDLLLLDIHLKKGTSFDILSKISYKNFDIIFITAFDEHAIKAIKTGALDYILKPIDDIEFNDAINKAIKNSKKENNLEKLIEISSDYFKGTSEKRIVLKTLEDVYIIYEKDILYCKSEGNYTTFYIQKLDKIIISKPIKKMIELLSKDVFIRCHKSYLVNKKHVIRYNNKKGVLIINSEIQIPVSSRRKDYVLKEIFK
ncbi:MULTISPECIES: LytR/AlgR family response regulator transcription factor [unclassified Tenacibaculum]|uniref:LytR/AlgR family response regulator transcription factor n=1 Tax=unclassified Tenacibaculum TaxID=2635139 RepID=UPI001F2BC744|nr:MULTISPECIES: response regulator [unclassified Tenacibaculum]MCF2876009.1 response regulator [Tenacibaculum sp. Cn5-1]MCF2936084.1 response regulator [Tenacibaculum sp. Cn5-34]MCG7512645.1 response regulator [Tenacibaculum sp. Cn5-46]